MMIALTDMKTRISYLKRAEIFKTEKPQSSSFPVDQFHEAAPTNHLFQMQETVVGDVRAAGNQEKWTLDCNGFCFIKA